MKKLWTTVAVLLLSAMLLAGCSENGDQQSGNRERAAQGEEEGTVTMKDNEGRDVVITNKQDIPELFPDDVPMPDSIQIVSSISSMDTVTIAMNTEMPFSEVVALYDGYLQEAGYEEAFRIDEADFYNYSGRRGNEQFVVTLQLDLEDNKTVTGALVYTNMEEGS